MQRHDDERRGMAAVSCAGLYTNIPTFHAFAPKDVRVLLEGAHSARDEAGGGEERGAEGKRRCEEYFAADVTRSSSRKGSPVSLNILTEQRW